MWIRLPQLSGDAIAIERQTNPKFVPAQKLCRFVPVCAGLFVLCRSPILFSGRQSLAPFFWRMKTIVDKNRGQLVSKAPLSPKKTVSGFFHFQACTTPTLSYSYYIYRYAVIWVSVSFLENQNPVTIPSTIEQKFTGLNFHWLVCNCNKLYVYAI